MPFLLLGFAVLPAPYRDEVRSALRADALGVVLGVLFAAIGLAALLLYLNRTRGKDPAMLWFSLHVGLYGVRLLAEASIVRFTIGGPELFWAYFRSAITYVIGLPSALLLYVLFPAWRRVLRLLIYGLAGFAAAGILCDQLLSRPASLETLNNLLVLACSALLMVVLFRKQAPAKDVITLRAGIGGFVATVVANNLAGLLHHPLRFNPEPVGFAFFLASLGVMVVRRAVTTQERLGTLEKEMEIARRIQMSILPRSMPNMPGLTVAARYLPMTAVAGDFYDFLSSGPDRLGILVADVSGHGVPAALIASMVKMAIAAQSAHTDNPALVLTGMNRMLAGQLKGQFVTAAYLYLDLVEGRMRYASAGHPPLLRQRAGQVEAVTENGLALGLRKASAYQYVEREITAGDRFLLYTDGLLEAMNDSNEQFGDERIRENLDAGKSLTADQYVAALVERLGEWAGYEHGRSQEDDLTLVVADVRTTSPPLPS